MEGRAAAGDNPALREDRGRRHGAAPDEQLGGLVSHNLSALATKQLPIHSRLKFIIMIINRNENAFARALTHCSPGGSNGSTMDANFLSSASVPHQIRARACLEPMDTHTRGNTGARVLIVNALMTQFGLPGRHGAYQRLSNAAERQGRLLRDDNPITICWCHSAADGRM